MQNLAFNLIAGLFAFIPALIANPAAVITGGRGKMDFGKNFIDGKRIFGDGKSISGYIGGIFIGFISGLIIYPILSYSGLLQFSPSIYAIMLASFALSWGSLTGDLAGSFIKRRIGMKRGAKGNLIDMWPFVIVAFLFLFLLEHGFFISLYGNFIDIVVILIITSLLHRGVNILAFKMHRKDVPW
ncbi:MAG: CDP-2,3-bis-(O-geranylgeranyl)-sn-glycerol synthase [Cuniculiplasma sp.]